MDVPISSDRLRLEPLRIEYANEMVDVLASPSLYEFIDGEPPTLEGLTGRYRYQIAGSGRPEEQWRNWIVRLADSGRAIGFVQADVTRDSAELAWVIGVADQGSGFASEAAIAMRNQLAIEGSTRFEAFIHADNVASQAVARRSGMVRTDVVDDVGEELWATPQSD